MQLLMQQSVTSGLADSSPPSELIQQSYLHDLLDGGLLQAWAGTLLATFLGLYVLGNVNRANLLWPVSGIALAMVLPHWHSGWGKRCLLILAAAAGFWTTASLLGMPWKLAAVLAAFTCIDVAIGGMALSPVIRAFDDLKSESNILRFLVIAVLVPLITGSLGAAPVSHFLNQPLWPTLLMNVFGNSLGMAISLPAGLLLQSPDLLGLRKLRQDKIRFVVTIILLFAVSFFVFWQTANPFLFMVFPPLILLVLTTGLEGAVFASVGLSMLGWLATTHGHGPILLARGTPLHQLLVFQGFVWICLAVSLPVGALLDERQRAQHKAKESESIYKSLLEHAEDLIILSSLDGSHRYVSPAVTRLVGWTQEEYLALNRFDTFHPDDRTTAEQVVESLKKGVREQTIRYRMLEKSGSWKWVRAAIRAYGVEGEAIAGYVGTIRDISDQMLTEENWQKERRGLVNETRKMATLASTDPLTGLLNRRGFEERVDALTHAARVPISLLMIDIDFFKRFNDTYGHQAGDDCLVRLARILQSHASRSDDIVARLGGEEFTVVLAGTRVEEAMLIAESISSELRSTGPRHSASPFGVTTVSIGAVVQKDDSPLDITHLVAHADKALYLSKQTRNKVTAYSR
jgi:diguanylate cyclase (GGDEF)-like protein/PAS domain S-box-containing protein